MRARQDKTTSTKRSQTPKILSVIIPSMSGGSARLLIQINLRSAMEWVYGIAVERLRRSGLSFETASGLVLLHLLCAPRRDQAALCVCVLYDEVPKSL